MTLHLPASRLILTVILAAALAASLDIAAAQTKKSTKSSPGATTPQTTVGSAELTAQECERLGGVVTANSDPNCKSNQRCKTTLSNGDIRSVCIDEVK